MNTKEYSEKTHCSIWPFLHPLFDEQRLEANRKPCRNSQRTNQRQVIAKYQRLPVNEDEDPKHTDGSDGLANTLWHVLPGRSTIQLAS